MWDIQGWTYTRAEGGHCPPPPRLCLCWFSCQKEKLCPASSPNTSKMLKLTSNATSVLVLPDPQNKDNLSFTHFIKILWPCGQYPAADAKFSLPGRDSLNHCWNIPVFWNELLQVLSSAEIGQKCVCVCGGGCVEKPTTSFRRAAGDSI